MTAIATDRRYATTAGRPTARRSRADGRPARENSRAGAGGMALLVVLAIGVIGAVGVVGSASGHDAALSRVADGAGPAAADEARPSQARADSAGAGTAATVTLGQGETVWEALRPHAPGDTRYEVFVHEVMQANDVDARELRPGDVVVVPDDAR